MYVDQLLALKTEEGQAEPFFIARVVTIRALSIFVQYYQLSDERKSSLRGPYAESQLWLEKEEIYVPWRQSFWIEDMVILHWDSAWIVKDV